MCRLQSGISHMPGPLCMNYELYLTVGRLSSMLIMSGNEKWLPESYAYVAFGTMYRKSIVFGQFSDIHIVQNTVLHLHEWNFALVNFSLCYLYLLLMCNYHVISIRDCKNAASWYLRNRRLQLVTEWALIDLYFTHRVFIFPHTSVVVFSESHFCVVWWYHTYIHKANILFILLFW